MSLYGSGRAEGIAAVVLIALLVVTVHCLGAVQVYGFDTDLATAGWSAIVPAVAGMTCYRFLRAQGRSRYAAFLAGIAHAWSPWLVSMSAAPREQIAMALAPLALEAACRVDRPSMRSVWLPWTGLCLALPFVAGLSVVAVLSFVLAGAALLRTVTCGDRDDERPPSHGILLAAVCGLAAAATLAWTNPLEPWFGNPAALPPGDVLAAYRTQPHTLDAAAVLRVPGPTLLLFAALGLMRRQRQVPTGTWLAVALAGTLPTALLFLQAGPGVWAATLQAMPMLPAASWWLTLFALTVLGAAGLDDFLDLPLRRRTALAWLLAFAVAASPLVPTFGAEEPALEWPLTGTFLLLALLLTTWRRLGILRFKRVLAVAGVLALAVPLLQVLPLPPTTAPAGPPAPAGETAPPAVPFLTRPIWHYSAFLLVLATSCVWSLSAFLRRRKARPVPTAAKAAIKKKARPPQR